MLTEGESRPFDAFDRFAQFTTKAGRSLDELLDEFSELRDANVRRLHELALNDGTWAMTQHDDLVSRSAAYANVLAIAFGGSWASAPLFPDRRSQLPHGLSLVEFEFANWLAGEQLLPRRDGCADP